jgi:hypothetical protein
MQVRPRFATTGVYNFDGSCQASCQGDMAKIAAMISHSGVVFGELKSKDLITHAGTLDHWYP